MLIQLCKFILLFLVLGFLFGGNSSKDRVDFVVVNDSSQNITDGSITFFDQTVAFKEIKAGSRISGSFQANREGVYHIKVRFESGEEIATGIAYISAVFGDYIEEITVTENDAMLTNSEIISKCIIF